MRHFYFRLIFAIVWLVCAVNGVMNVNFSFAVLYALVGIVFGWSAYSVWKKENSDE